MSPTAGHPSSAERSCVDPTRSEAPLRAPFALGNTGWIVSFRLTIRLLEAAFLEFGTLYGAGYHPIG
jgi:hypothetical protein